MREDLKKARKLGNKGFSLIELIIVIAIMGILIGIVGMQIVPYIEKSRQAKDQQVIGSVLVSATTAFASNVEKYDNTAAQTFSFDDTTSKNAGMTSVISEFHALSGYDTIAALKTDLTSKAGASIKSITIARDANGVVTVTTEVSDTKYSTVFEVLSST